jgi:hypothetical protein
MLAFPNAKIGSETIVIYAKALSELSKAELSAGVLKTMRTCKFFPSIAEIMEAAQEIVEVATGTDIKSPDQAWNEVQRQMHDAFIYHKPKFSAPEIGQAAEAMGWSSLCNTPADQMGTARAQFLKLYDSVCKRKKRNRINQKVLNQMGSAAVNEIVKSTAKQIGNTKSQ